MYKPTLQMHNPDPHQAFARSMATKNHLIYQELLNRLLSGQYRFGDKIAVKAISEDMGVSKQPIMTALYRLQDNGLLRITAQVGCEILQPSIDEIHDFYKMFASMEGLLAELAAQRATEQDIAHLQFLNEQIAAIPLGQESTGKTYQQLNQAFHTHIHHMARSPFLHTRQRSNFELCDFYIVQSRGFADHVLFAPDEHNEIIDAIRQRDTALAGKHAREHIDSVADNVIAGLSTEKAVA